MVTNFMNAFELNL